MLALVACRECSTEAAKIQMMPRQFRPCCALILVALLSSSGCSELAVRLGFRIRLDDKPVTAVSASLKSKGGSAVSALGPGQSAWLVLVATTQDGMQYATVGAGKGKVAFDNYTITATVVQVTAGGKV